MYFCLSEYEFQLGTFVFSVNCSIGDAICFQLLEDKPGNYGRQRVFGSIGNQIFFQHGFETIDIRWIRTGSMPY